MRRHTMATLVAGAVVATGAAGVLPAHAEGDGPVVLSDGHVDAFEVSRQDDELVMMLKDDTVWGNVAFRDPANVILHVVPEAEWELPGWLADFPEFAFLGEPGDIVYYLPDFQVPGLLWPGASSERLVAADFRGDTIELAVTGMDGPGALKLYTIDGIGGIGEVMVDSADPSADNTWRMFIRSHAHFNWVFTEPGVYVVTAQARAVLSDGTPIASDPVDYTFVVGEWRDPGGPPDDVSQRIVTTIDETDGALIISVDPDDREVVMPAMRLAADGQSLETSGELRPVTVTDTRPGHPGWSASGQVSDFSGGGATFSAGYLGWQPRVVSQAAGQGVQAGIPVPAGFPSGAGLSESRTLASAPSGQGRGTARLGASLELRVPTGTPPQTYRATLTLTAI